MRQISLRVSRQIESDPLSKVCWRAELLEDHQCLGRITMDHAVIHSGQQVDEAWAIVPTCSYAHSVDQWQDGGIHDKEIQEWIALNRMKPEDEAKYPNRDWSGRREYLNEKYGYKTLGLEG